MLNPNSNPKVVSGVVQGEEIWWFKRLWNVGHQHQSFADAVRPWSCTRWKNCFRLCPTNAEKRSIMVKILSIIQLNLSNKGLWEVCD